MNLPLLITACLDPGRTPQVALSDIRERTLRHMEGLIAWLREPWVRQIVFAKNCGTSVRQQILIETASRYGKELEFVQVPSSSRTAIQGKGYGEGDLICQALDKSEVLRTSRDFIKVTGKLFLPCARTVFDGKREGEFFVITPTPSPADVFPTRRMLNPLYRYSRMGRGLAWLRTFRVPWECLAACPAALVDTRCYRVETRFYREHLLRTHERVQDALGYNLEHAFFDDLEGASPRRIPQPPVIIGVSGTLGSSAGTFPEEVTGEAYDLTEQLLSIT
jgi:hypothetical protein